MNWFKYANRFVITHYNQTYNELGVVAENGREYLYQGISPFFYEKIKKLAGQNRWGEAWQLLRRLENRQRDTGKNLFN